MTMPVADLTGWTVAPFSAAGYTHDVYRKGEGPGVVLIPEMPGLHPGVLALGKFLLATTKDQAHRVYLRDGIFAEVTLRFQDGAFRPWPWTYADYREQIGRAHV